MDSLVRQLVPSTDEILFKKTERFDFSNPPIHPSELAHILAQTMIANNGIGLAAPQVGLPYRAFVMTGKPITCCFNPIIVDISSEEIYLEEGCLTFPNLIVKVKRPKMIRARYTNPDGQTVTNKFIGMTARIFQHELDHLNGILFTQRANSYHLEQARKKKVRMK
jgi:peptide deformylase